MSNKQWSEWIEWNGGECPLPYGALCDIETRSGEIKRRIKANLSEGRSPNAGPVFWLNEASPDDIIAYRYKIEELDSKGTSKPNWNDAPEWAKWLAQDDDGEWFWYEDQPTDKNFSWRHSSDGRIRSAGLSEKNEAWAFTLESRPADPDSAIMTEEEEEMPAEERTRTAPDFLSQAASIMQERGKQYDQPGGERSMGKTIAAFNAITGRDLSEPEGWMLMGLLKTVRQYGGDYHQDSAEDKIAYAALEAESLEASALRARELKG